MYWILPIPALVLVWAFYAFRESPDEIQARGDFLTEHPNYQVEHVIASDEEVDAVCFRIFYRVPGNSNLREEFRQYLCQDGKWSISHRWQEDNPGGRR